MSEEEKDGQSNDKGKEAIKKVGKPRVQRADRSQIAVQFAALDDMIPADHLVRVVWAMVGEMDLGTFYAVIESVEGAAGRSAIDPAILISVWLFAVLQGVGSARELARLCEEHICYRWILGGVSVNYHTLADFRSEHGDELDRLLKEGVAALLAEGLIDLEETAQDGMRIRGGAGKNSFHRRETLEKHLQKAEERVEQLKESSEQSSRKEAAQKRAAKEKVGRVKQALEELGKIEKQREKAHRKKERTEPRTSETDSEVHILKMAAGGYRPAVNAEVVVETKQQIILGVDVVNTVDQGQMTPMLEKIQASYGEYPVRHLVDKGFVTISEIEIAEQHGVAVYAPIPSNYAAQDSGGTAPKPTESHFNGGVQNWLSRMGTEEAKAIYKHRPASVECTNADARQRGYYQVLVRGLKKVRAVFLWFALAHNLLRTWAIRKQRASALAAIGG
jgi:transposase